MFFLFGGGRRNPGLRIALVAAMAGSAVIFHHSGSAYWTIRGIYYAVILVVLGGVAWRRYGQRAKRPFNASSDFDGASGGSWPAGGPSPSEPTADPYGPVAATPDAPPSVLPLEAVVAPAPPAPDGPTTTALPAFGTAGTEQAPPPPPERRAAAQPPGWYADPSDEQARHYWDGIRWTQTVRWDGKGWQAVS